MSDLCVIFLLFKEEKYI